MADVPRSIRMQGFSPGVAVQLTARLREADGLVWQSEAVFAADRDGAVDLRTATPLSGDWSEPSAMAPIWAMRGSSDEPRARVLGPASTAPLHVELEARSPDGVARAALVQAFLAPGVERRDLHEDGMVATLFTPGRPGPHPLVVVLAGSGGGLMERRAALFAAHGYQAMALGYFGAPGLPDHISGTRLEYFERALTWALRVLEPANGFVALCGVSRGAELSLLLASHYPALVSAVIAYVPSPVTHGVLNAGKTGEDRHAPAWFRGNEPLPVMSVGNRTADWALFDEAATPRAQTPAMLAALGDPEAVARAMIPIEQMAGPLLMISGEDDALWPSARFAEMARIRLAEAGFAYPVEHHAYAGAGHTIEYPFCPTTMVNRPHPVSRIPLAFGGTADGNARANEQSWATVLRFLSQSVAHRPTGGDGT